MMDGLIATREKGEEKRKEKRKKTKEIIKSILIITKKGQQE